ncbi:predicted protein [Uncinocarpus reesii 1704]|uniref:Uncharacterized protein n=1 Tax=Uncinocarpus reesii (strain UAMH 1704) TaxID=336963 RepID=C4JXD1_UNCRE|nr:uncharacterized protein UREG_06304 [Uncinocarpus reesii 1704]EEP81439.1 predicted protein [Uncinocarpus reesii 1704]
MNFDNDMTTAGGGEVEAEPMERTEKGSASGRPQTRKGPGRFSSSRISSYAHPDELRATSEMRERRHAAMSILNDPELLMFHALSSNESIPQTRKRFLHHLIGIPPPTTRPFAIRDISEHHPEDTQHVYLRRQTQSKRDGAASGSTKTSYTAYEHAPTMIDIIEINGGWEDDPEDEAGPGRAKGVQASGSSGASPGPSGRMKGKGRV